ncbi:ATP-binding protein [Paenibacillus cymbidii]|uniref:ATP-binding protein n=1 Tax=Paenibacillus cymbidii TaxID=1639034 RepID=UPI001F2B15E7|nr:ATP-binding protein [Paenibacillus cymbidii]
MRKRQDIWMTWRSYISITLLIVLMTAALQPLGLALDLVNIALIYLFPVLLSAVLWGIRPAIFATVLAVLAFDFYFVPPLLSFTIADLRYLVSFGVYLAVAWLISNLAARLKQQLVYAKKREAHTAALYELSRQMSAITDIHVLLENVSRQISQFIGTENAIFLPDDRNRLVLIHRSATSSDWGLGESERVIAKLAFDHGEPAGYGSRTLRDTPGYYLPLRTEDRVFGVLALNLKERSIGLTAEQQRLLEALGGLAASGIARVKLAEEAKIAHLMAESERLRTAILDSVSHELRTPLAAIIGSATGLIQGDHLFTSEDRMELLVTIRDGALRMNRLVINLLSMVRLESGMLSLRKNWCDVEDLIGVVLAQVKEFQEHRELKVRLPDSAPMVVGDEVLLEQMLVNVVGNAIKYSPDYSEIDIAVSTEEGSLVIAVSDQGTGLADEEYERIFEKFYRADATKQITGTGLGLAICKGIVELHNGTISGKRREPQGSVMTIALPLPEQNGLHAIPTETGTESDDHG